MLRTDPSPLSEAAPPLLNAPVSRAADKADVDSLGTQSNSASTSRKSKGAEAEKVRRESRRERLRLRQGVQQIEGVGFTFEDGQRVRNRFGFCGAGMPEVSPETPIPGVVIRTREDGKRRASMSGIQRCKSPWLCSMCGPLIRSERAAEVRAGIDYWTEAGGGVAFASFTIRHQRGDSLVELRKGLTKAFSKLQGSRPWRRFREQYGVVGIVRALDITHGSNGWHPHLHCLVVLDETPSDDELSLIRQGFSDQWATVVERHLGLAHVPRSDSVGVDLRAADAGAAKYLAKVEGGWDTADELARTDAKSGRSGSRVPAEIMASAVDPNSESRSADEALVVEFAEAMQGVPALSWSRGLKALLGVLDVDDDEALEQGQERADSDGSEIVSEERVSLAAVDMSVPPSARVVAE